MIKHSSIQSGRIIQYSALLLFLAIFTLTGCEKELEINEESTSQIWQGSHDSTDDLDLSPEEKKNLSLFAPDISQLLYSKEDETFIYEGDMRIKRQVLQEPFNDLNLLNPNTDDLSPRHRAGHWYQTMTERNVRNIYIWMPSPEQRAVMNWDLLNYTEVQLDAMFAEFTSAIFDWNSMFTEHTKAKFVITNALIIPRDYYCLVDIAPTLPINPANLTPSLAIADLPRETVGSNIVWNASSYINNYSSAMNRNNGSSFYLVMQHELGHVLGLKHTDRTNEGIGLYGTPGSGPSIMNALIENGAAITPDDAIAIELLYPTHDNGYNIDVTTHTATDPLDPRASMEVFVTNKKPDLPHHIKIKTTVRKVSGGGIDHDDIERVTERFRHIHIPGLYELNRYEVTVQGCNYRVDECFEICSKRINILPLQNDPTDHPEEHKILEID